MKYYYIFARLLNPLFLAVLRLKTHIKPTERARVLLRDDKDNILLVRPVFGSHVWELPGGARHSSEPLAGTAVRELYEETGVLFTEDKVTFVIEYLRPYPMSIFTATIAHREVSYTSFEIKEIRWFGRTKLPNGTAPYIRDII